MRYSRRALIVVAALAWLLGVGSVALILSSPQTHAEGTFALRGVYAAVLQAAAFVVTDTRAPDAGCTGCPPNPVLIFGSSSLAGLAMLLQLIFSFVFLSGLVLATLRRLRRATAGQRRSLGPVLSA